MRRFFPLFFVFALLLPAQSAAAQSIVCQTVNGPRPLGDLAAELRGVGFAGPFDPSSMAAAYANASGASVDCGQATARHDVVVLVGGLGSNLSSDSDTFAILKQQMPQKLAAGDLLTWSYADNAGVDGDSCQTMPSSMASLARFLRSLRDSHRADSVQLIGHSNGGDVVLFAVAGNPDLLPFVRTVVTVDSPLAGLSSTRAFLRALTSGPCQAGEELVNLASAPTRDALLSSAVGALQSKGVSVWAVFNPNDNLVPSSAQQLPAVVNLEIDAFDGLSNHWAVFKDPAAARQLVTLLAG